MHCPFCYEADTKVIDSRLSSDGASVRRRRECINHNCHARFTTYEVIDLALPRVIKKDQSTQSFDIDKLRQGLLKALEKRPISLEVVDKAVQNIMSKIQALAEKEILAQTIGDFAMEELKQIDRVAYVRFASVYRSFEDVQAFKNEIELLGAEGK